MARAGPLSVRKGRQGAELTAQCQTQAVIAIGGVAGEQFLGSEALLLNQRSGLKVAGKDLSRVAAHRLARFRAAEDGGGSHAHQLVARAVETIAQPADQAGQIGALGAIEGVELIDHQLPLAANNGEEQGMLRIDAVRLDTSPALPGKSWPM